MKRFLLFLWLIILPITLTSVLHSAQVQAQQMLGAYGISKNLSSFLAESFQMAIATTLFICKYI